MRKTSIPRYCLSVFRVDRLIVLEKGNQHCTGLWQIIATTKFMKLGAEVVATKLSLLKKGLHTINHYDHELNTVTHRFNTAHQQYARACKSKCFLRSTLHTVLLTNRSLYCAWVLADQVADEAFASVSVPMANLRTSPHYTHSDSVWTFRGLPYGK